MSLSSNICPFNDILCTPLVKQIILLCSKLRLVSSAVTCKNVATSKMVIFSLLYYLFINFVLNKKTI